MKVVLISDTHLRHERGPVDVPPGDVLVHAGDALLGGDLGELWTFARWFEALPHPHKVFVPGNHDRIFEDAEDLGRAGLKCATVLLDQEATVAGLRVYGSPWQPEFQDWAFNLPRGRPLAEKWNRIPSGLDILVTHGPPAGILDDGARNERLGCRDLREAVERTRPRVHVFGHIHPGYGAKEVGPTLFVNASVCDPAYRAVNRPIVLEMDETRLEMVKLPGRSRRAEGPVARGSPLWGD